MDSADAVSWDESGHHSLVTPIDWKPRADRSHRGRCGGGHHSLVTSIDWKRLVAVGDGVNPEGIVTSRW